MNILNGRALDAEGFVLDHDESDTPDAPTFTAWQAEWLRRQFPASPSPEATSVDALLALSATFSKRQGQLDVIRKVLSMVPNGRPKE